MVWHAVFVCTYLWRLGNPALPIRKMPRGRMCAYYRRILRGGRRVDDCKIDPQPDRQMGDHVSGRRRSDVLGSVMAARQPAVKIRLWSLLGRLLFHSLLKRDEMFLYSSIITKIDSAIINSQTIAQSGIETVWSSCEKSGISMAAICKSSVQKMPTTMNQLPERGTEKAERLSLRQLNT